MSPYSTDLDELLAPVPKTTFLDRYLGKNFLHIPGRSDKLAHLVSWADLNRTLALPHITNNVAVVKNGVPIDPGSYSSSFRLLASELTDLLRTGATLIVSALDEFLDPIAILAQRLSRAFLCRVRVNLYGAWCLCYGFEPHWDDHDVFILQVHGTKLWKIYGEAQERYPVGAGRASKEFSPPGVIWEQCLSPGDVLYIPRGWWHFAEPRNEATIHLTVGLHHPTGADLLGWLSERLEQFEGFRMDVPRFSSADQANYINSIREIILKELADSNLIGRFFEELNAKASPRSWFGLPWTAAANGIPVNSESRLILATPRPLDIRSGTSPDEVEVRFNGKIYTFDKTAVPLLNSIATEDGCLSVAAFYKRWTGTIEEEDLGEFLADLARSGIVTFV
jgi:ribosomal protein L16 Arg81 hydroxylase